MDPSDHEQERIERLRRAMYSRELSEQLKGRSRRELHDIETRVGEGWHSIQPQLSGVTVAPRFLGITRKILWWVLVASVVFFVGAIAFFAYYFTFGGGSLPAAPGNIDISVTGPTQIMGGERADLQIVITNRNKVPPELADLVVTHPSCTRSPTDFTTDFPSQR